MLYSFSKLSLLHICATAEIFPPRLEMNQQPIWSGRSQGCCQCWDWSYWSHYLMCTNALEQVLAGWKGVFSWVCSAWGKKEVPFFLSGNVLPGNQISPEVNLQLTSRSGEGHERYEILPIILVKLVFR